MAHLDVEALTAAAAGNAGCAYTLGIMFAKQHEYDEAVKWLRIAAETHISAQLSLGIMYAEGRGVQQNHKEAVRWFRKAGQFNPYAQYNMGVMYMKGNGVVQNIARAEKWFRRAASQNHLPAIEFLTRISLQYR
jgi:TPR repeat protein